jgi:hypothetical protein
MPYYVAAASMITSMSTWVAAAILHHLLLVLMCTHKEVERVWVRVRVRVRVGLPDLRNSASIGMRQMGVIEGGYVIMMLVRGSACTCLCSS